LNWTSDIVMLKNKQLWKIQTKWGFIKAISFIQKFKITYMQISSLLFIDGHFFNCISSHNAFSRPH
jgi:hypothetical protein